MAVASHETPFLWVGCRTPKANARTGPPAIHIMKRWIIVDWEWMTRQLDEEIVHLAKCWLQTQAVRNVDCIVARSSTTQNNWERIGTQQHLEQPIKTEMNIGSIQVDY